MTQCLGATINNKKNQPQKDKKIIFLAGLVLLTAISCVSYLSRYYRHQQSKTITSKIVQPTRKQLTSKQIQPSIPTANEFTAAQIAYAQNGDIWILDTVKGIKEKITKTSVNRMPKWSPDGSKLAWIESKKINVGEWSEDFPINIKIVDFQSGDTDYLLEEYNLASLKAKSDSKKRKKTELLGLHSFDWSPDSKKIVYLRNGVWIKNLGTKKETRILKPYLEKEKIMQDPLPKEIWDLDGNSYLYTNVKFSPDGKKILLEVEKSFMGSKAYSVYNLNTKSKKNIIAKTALLPNEIEWSPDSSKILFGGECGMNMGGTHYYDLATDKTKTIHEAGTLGIKWLDKDRFVTIKCNQKDECWSNELGYGLVVLNLKGQLVNTLIPKIKVETNMLFSYLVSPDKKWIIIGNTSGPKKAIPLQGGKPVDIVIESEDLSWRPITNGLNPKEKWKTYLNHELRFQINIPENWQVQITPQSTRTAVKLGNNLTITSGVYYNQDLQKELTFNKIVEMAQPTDGQEPQNFILGGIRGKKYVYKIGVSTTAVFIIAPQTDISNTQVITVRYLLHPGTTEQIETIEKTLQTFRFL